MSNKPYVILTELTSDLPQDYLKKNNVIGLPLTYSLGDKEYDGTPENSLTSQEFYEILKKGAKSKTAQITPEKAMNFYEEQIKNGYDVLHIAFSSGLSGSYNSAMIAKEDLSEKYPDFKIICVDSLSASLGQGLLVDYAVKMRDKGCSIEEVAQAVEDIKLKLCHYFTVDDLNHLYRGGRVSKTAAVFGTMLGIKPVMHVDDDGHLIPIGKVRGRKASLDELVLKMGSKLDEYKNPYVFISHGESLADAQYVEEQIKKIYGVHTQIINCIGPVIGSHSGPGTIALFFFGSNRKEKNL